MNFVDAYEYLLSLGNEVDTMKLGLENIMTLLAALGEPQTKYKKVQVAGTNGKGSVCAFLDSICGEAGIRRGLYTSPHLVSITERIKIDGVDISEAEFARIASLVRETSETLVAEGSLERVPTFFEQVTAIALVAFAEADVELAILETGLGGRYDAVTAAYAEGAAITRIDLDHQEYLGDTIEEIAAEKAAIISGPSLRLVIGDQSDAVLRLIQEHREEMDVADTDELYSRWKVRKVNENDVRVETSRHIFPSVTLGLKGAHQVENAETAINLAKVLGFEFGFGDRLDDAAIINGLEEARHPGRLESIAPNFLFDGAHNPGGAKALRQYLDESELRPITLIFGAMRDKSVAEIADILWPRAETIILTQPSNSRAMTADELAQFVPESVNVDRIFKTDNLADAIEKAKELTAADGLILVTGSLYLVGEVKQLLQRSSAI
ncbi:MAG TPA: folylpolyglutamate synthase/dihydrofolate synthase family protein [Pyrinomonadaceae bacterium]|nr:folylpolyglutamate synthase/dihydrofolate synthase family protein [Pyrinomonadaceae bacterium]